FISLGRYAHECIVIHHLRSLAVLHGQVHDKVTKRFELGHHECVANKVSSRCDLRLAQPSPLISRPSLSSLNSCSFSSASASPNSAALLYQNMARFMSSGTPKPSSYANPKLNMAGG